MHIVDSTLFFAPRSGGVKRYLLAKQHFLKGHSGIRHSIVVPGSANASSADGLVEVASPAIPFADGYRIPLSINAWANRLCELQPTVIEAGDPYHLAWAALRAANRMSVPTVAFAHSDLSRMIGMRFGKSALKMTEAYLRTLYSRFDLVVAASHSIAHRIRELGIEHVAVQPLGVDVELFHPCRRDPDLRAKLSLPNDARLLVYAGRFSAEKNIPLLYQAINRLGNPYHLLVVGAEHTRRLSDRITLMEYQQDTVELARLIASCDALIHAGEHETFGLVFLEAMSCGIPVIGVRSGAVPEIVSESVGRIAEPNDIESLCGAVTDLFDYDPQTIGAHARAHVCATYGWSQVFERQLRYYSVLLTEPRPLTYQRLASLGT